MTDRTVVASDFLSSSSSNILLLRGGLYGELYEGPYNMVLSAIRAVVASDFGIGFEYTNWSAPVPAMQARDP
jgi:hypothetical protein